VFVRRTRLVPGGIYRYVDVDTKIFRCKPADSLRNNPDRIAFLNQADIDHLESVFGLFNRAVLARTVRLDGRLGRTWLSSVDPDPSIEDFHDDFGCRDRN